MTALYTSYESFSGPSTTATHPLGMYSGTVAIQKSGIGSQDVVFQIWERFHMVQLDLVVNAKSPHC